MTDQQSITPEQAADLLVPLLPELGRAETYPQWSDAAGGLRRGQRVTLYDVAGDILGATREEHRAVLRVLLRVEGGDWDRPQTFTVDGATLELTYPVVPVVPLWMSPLAAAEPDPARDFAASVAAGHVTPVDWGVCDPVPAPAQSVEDVQVQGGAL